MANTYNLIEAKTLTTTTASVTFSSIPATFTDLNAVLSGRSDAAGRISTAMILSFNGSTSNRSSRTLYASNGTPGSDNFATNIFTQDGATCVNATANTFSNYSLYIPNYASSNNKSLSVDSVIENNAANVTFGFTAGLWSDSAAITSITFTPENGSFIQYSTFYLYGIKNS